MAEKTVDSYQAGGEMEAIQESVLAYQLGENTNQEGIEESKLGETLVDKDLSHGEDWNIIVENDTKEKYQSGWNYVEKGSDIPGYGTAQYNWVVNYETGEVKKLEDNKYTHLDPKKSLAVWDDLVMNVDATNLEGEGNKLNWGNVEPYGDPTYNSADMAITFDGQDDYLQLSKPGTFSNGFTFEIYGDFDRFVYDKTDDSNGKAGPLFCKMKNLSDDYYRSMRFFFLEITTTTEYSTDGDYMFCKFIGTTESFAKGDKLKGEHNGGVIIDGDSVTGTKTNRKSWINSYLRNILSGHITA